NFDNNVLRALRRENADVDIVRVQDTEMVQADDPDVLEWAANEGRILLTHDVRTMPHYAYERVRDNLPMLGIIAIQRSAPQPIHPLIMIQIPRLASFLLPIALLLTGCGREPAAAKNPDGSTVAKKLTIAVVPKATTHSYWKTAESGARRAAEELGVNIEWQGPLDDSKIADQIGILNNLAASGVDGILISPSDDKALAPHIRAISKRGLPVCLFDSPLDGKAGVDYVNFAATDNRRAGEIAAENVIKLAGENPAENGAVLMIRFTEGSASTRLREEGFLAALGRAPALKVVDQQFTDGSMAGAQRVAEALLGNYVQDGRLKLAAIFASNQPTAEGTHNALRALRTKGIVVNTRFVGFDESELLAQGVDNGQIDALVVQDPAQMGYLGVKSVVAAIRGEKTEPYIDTGVTLRTKKTAP
ncbi:MAG: DUF5615 family PIN-like protein, partial [Burkholderiales bacterium]|nr:DUF5615 family PIN-like protein [Opitutaceae bacterium]